MADPKLPVLLQRDSLAFPPVSQALSEPNGLLAVGGDLSTKRLLKAYQQGIFPWYNPGEPLLWWSPDPRLILIPDKIKIAKSLRRSLKQQDTHQVSFDAVFEEVINACAAPRQTEQGTWIDDSMIRAYCHLHRLGYAHSVEVWHEDTLVGGLYGVSLGRAFFGESMFSLERDASKIALVSLAARLRIGGFQLLDCQFMNRHLEQFGAKPLHRVAFRKLLDKATQVTAAFPEELSDREMRQFLQSRSQTSKTGCSIALSAGEDANIQPWNTGSGSVSFGTS